MAGPCWPRFKSLARNPWWYSGSGFPEEPIGFSSNNIKVRETQCNGAAACDLVGLQRQDNPTFTSPYLIMFLYYISIHWIVPVKKQFYYGGECYIID